MMLDSTEETNLINKVNSICSLKLQQAHFTATAWLGKSGILLLKSSDLLTPNQPAKAMRIDNISISCALG
jgi:hypothetical protein